MVSRSRFSAARRVLDHFFWTKMRGARRDLALGGIRIAALTAADGRIALTAHASGPLRLSSDAGTMLALPDAGGRIEVSLPGLRHLMLQDEATGCETAVPLYQPWNWVSAGLRAAMALVQFPLRHGADILGYFLRGDSAAGDRMERALLPQLAPLDHIPEAGVAFFGPAPLPEITEPVEIIIPVYNAAEVLRICLDRLAANTPEPHRIWLIDDASPDPAIGPILQAFATAHPQAEVLTNAVNLGFVGTANRGLEMARGHVVLLNTDALVPAGWLRRVMAPILAAEDVASVTPLSNDAEIFDVPVECVPRILNAREAEEADRAARSLDWRSAQAEVPTGVGFCMAMARAWLDRTGPLDPIFGRGYGEEVDWCRRAAALGGRHIGLGSLFVEHRSGSSFGAEKSERLLANNRIVARRYPTYDLMVQQFRDADPLVGPRLAVGLGLLAGDAGVPVYLAHRLGGGAEHWLQDRIAADVARGGVALVLREDADSARLVVELHAAQGRTRGLMIQRDVAALLAIPRRIELIYSCLVGAQDPLALISALVAGLRPQDRLTLLFHDFLPLCPAYTLVGTDGRYCGLPGAEACQACYAGLPVTSGARPARIADWRGAWRQLAERAERLEVFSRDSQAQVLAVWPDLAAKLAVVPHDPGHLPVPLPPPVEDGVLTLGVLGAIGRQKGAAVLQGLAAASGKTFRIVVIGKIDPAYAHPAMVVHGPYLREEIGDLARSYRVDCWLIPSIWPETFCFTAHECLATGLPVYAFDIGAQAEAVRAAPNGRLLPLDAPLTAESFLPVVNEGAALRSAVR